METHVLNIYLQTVPSKPCLLSFNFHLSKFPITLGSLQSLGISSAYLVFVGRLYAVVLCPQVGGCCNKVHVHVAVVVLLKL